MTSDFQHYFIEAIKKVSNDNKLLVEQISNLLQQKNSNVYKKLSAQVPFSMAEVQVVARHYDISLDRIVHQQRDDFGKVLLDYSLSESLKQTPVGFLEKIRKDLERIVQLPQPRVMYATNEIPLFHSLACPKLMAFKLYVWCSTNWQLPEMEGLKFDPDAFYAQWPGLNEHRLAIMDLYDRIPGCEYWPRTLLDNILNQIRYYAEAHYFSDPAMPHHLHEEMLEMLEGRKKMAAEGRKCTNDVSFNIFLNETAYTNNIILVCNADHPIAVYATMDNPNFLRSNDPVFCKRMQQWINQVDAVSFNLTKKLNRDSLFGELVAKIKKNDLVMI